MSNKSLIPYITSYMIKNQPDQVAAVINRLIDEVNRLNQSR